VASGGRARQDGDTNTRLDSDASHEELDGLRANGNGHLRPWMDGGARSASLRAPPDIREPSGVDDQA
jgi:hypothetical protein